MRCSSKTLWSELSSKMNRSEEKPLRPAAHSGRILKSDTRGHEAVDATLHGPHPSLRDTPKSWRARRCLQGTGPADVTATGFAKRLDHSWARHRPPCAAGLKEAQTIARNAQLRGGQMRAYHQADDRQSSHVLRTKLPGHASALRRLG